MIDDKFIADFIKLSVKVASAAECHIEMPDKNSLANLDGAQKKFWRFMQANMSEIKV